MQMRKAIRVARFVPINGYHYDRRLHGRLLDCLFYFRPTWRSSDSRMTAHGPSIRWLFSASRTVCFHYFHRWRDSSLQLSPFGDKMNLLFFLKKSTKRPKFHPTRRLCCSRWLRLVHFTNRIQWFIGETYKRWNRSPNWMGGKINENVTIHWFTTAF